MKAKLHRFVNTPHHVGIVSLIIALALGAIVYMQVHRAPAHPYTPTADTLGDQNGTQVQDLTLGFVSGGRIASVSVKTGDVVHTGEQLAALDNGAAAGALSQARAAYDAAQANYQKVINGATGTAIDVARTAQHSAQVALDAATKQQQTLVDNAYRTLLNSNLVAESDTDSTLAQPAITGTYTKGTEGTLSIEIHQTGSTGYLKLTGLVTGTADVPTAGTPVPLLDTGLSLTVPSLTTYDSTNWHITIPNTKASNYLANYNAYLSAKEMKTQVVAAAQSALDQATANLALAAAAARPEDVASAQAQVENAKGTLQIAAAAYNNTVITSPSDGTVTAVMIAPGQIAQANAPAIMVHISKK